ASPRARALTAHLGSAGDLAASDAAWLPSSTAPHQGCPRRPAVGALHAWFRPDACAPPIARCGLRLVHAELIHPPRRWRLLRIPRPDPTTAFAIDTSLAQHAFA